MTRFCFFVLCLSTAPFIGAALVADASSRQRSRLAQAFSSPSGKLTFSPEIILPEPSDPTALLLQSNAVKTLSGRVRSGKASAVFLRCSTTALNYFVKEQETAFGSFPGPVPAIFCLSPSDEDIDIQLAEIAEAGADGVLIPANEGSKSMTLDDLTVEENQIWVRQCQSARNHGLEPIPELFIGQKYGSSLSADSLCEIVEKVIAAVGVEPVTLVLTLVADHDESDEIPILPTIPKSLGKRIPIIGSIRMPAGENRLSIEAARFKQAGFNGAFLRSECLPGYRAQLDLELVGQFWAACIDDLKSVKSKNFSFRSKNNMDKDLATKWINYRSSVLESGALGDPSDNASIMDSAAGDYKGFA